MNKAIEAGEIGLVPVPESKEPTFDAIAMVRYEAFQQGYERGLSENERGLSYRARIGNQRKELRRLNRKLNAIQLGAKLS